MSGLFSCCGKRDKPAAVETAKPSKKYPALQWEHVSRPDWGIQDILVPQDSCIRRSQNGALIGDISNPKGTFKIEPQINKLSREKFVSRVEVYATFFDEASDKAMRAELVVPDNTYFTFTETNTETWGILHHAALLAPYSDKKFGVIVTFDIDRGEADVLARAKIVTQQMLSSIEWVDRNIVCTPAESKIVGSWLHVREQAANKQNPYKLVIIQKMKFFEEGLWGFWKWELKAPLEIKPEEVNEKEHTMSEFATGEYLAYECDGKLHLYLVSTNGITPVQIETITVTGNKEKLIRQGGDEYQCIEKGQPYRPTIEEAWGIKLNEHPFEGELDTEKDVEKNAEKDAGIPDGAPKTSEEDAAEEATVEGEVSQVEEEKQTKARGI